MYPLLYSEIAKSKVPISTIAEKLNVSLVMVALMLIGELSVTFGEAKIIKDVIGTDVPLEELFAEAE